MRRVVTAALLAAATAATAATAVPPAGAAPHQPMTMTASGGTQDGNLRYYTSSRVKGSECAVTYAGGTAAVPDPVVHDGSELVWRIPDARRPLKVVATKSYYFPVVGYIGSDLLGSDLEVSLRRVRSGSRVVAWEAVSEPVGSGDLAVTLYVSWQAPCAVDEAKRIYRVLSLEA